MDDAARMGKGQSVSNAQQDLDILFQALVGQVTGPRHAADIFHSVEEGSGFGFANVVDWYDVWVIEVTGNCCFRQQPCLDVATFRLVRPDHLQGNSTVNGRLPCLIDDTHATFAENIDELEIRFVRRRFTGACNNMPLDDQVRRLVHTALDLDAGHQLRPHAGVGRHDRGLAGAMCIRAAGRTRLRDSIKLGMAVGT